MELFKSFRKSPRESSRSLSFPARSKKSLPELLSVFTMALILVLISSRDCLFVLISGASWLIFSLTASKLSRLLSALAVISSFDASNPALAFCKSSRPACATFMPPLIRSSVSRISFIPSSSLSVESPTVSFTSLISVISLIWSSVPGIIIIIRPMDSKSVVLIPM